MYHCSPGRYTGHGTDSGEIKVTHADSRQGLAALGFKSASNQIPGFSGEFKNNEDLSAGGKDSEGDEGVQAHNQQEISDSWTLSPLDRAAVIDSTGSRCATPPLPRLHQRALQRFQGNYDHKILVDDTSVTSWLLLDGQEAQLLRGSTISTLQMISLKLYSYLKVYVHALVMPSNNTLSYVQLCHDMELKDLEVKLEFH